MRMLMMASMRRMTMLQAMATRHRVLLVVVVVVVVEVVVVVLRRRLHQRLPPLRPTAALRVALGVAMVLPMSVLSLRR